MSVSVSVSEPEEASSSQESARVVGFLALEVGLMVRLLRVLERSGRGVSCGVREGKVESGSRN